MAPSTPSRGVGHANLAKRRGFRYGSHRDDVRARRRNRVVTDDQRDFTAKVAQAIKTLRPKEEVKVVTSLRLKLDGPGGARLIELDKLYESCKGEHAICREAFLKLVGDVAEAPVATTRAEVERVRKW